MDEVQRITEAYSKRRGKTRGKYPELFSRQREAEIKEAIRKGGIPSLPNKRVLDVGCGDGAVLSYFLKEGVAEENLYGIDLIPERIAQAERLHPGVSFTCGNAERLPYPDDFFDIITQSTVLTSILDSRMKKAIAAEVLRVLKRFGLIVWHDYRFNNPFNPNVRGIGKREIMNLFPDCQFDFKLINLNPLIARPLAEFSWKLCEVLENVPILRTHWLVIIKKSNLNSEKLNE